MAPTVATKGMDRGGSVAVEGEGEVDGLGAGDVTEDDAVELHGPHRFGDQCHAESGGDESQEYGRVRCLVRAARGETGCATTAYDDVVDRGMSVRVHHEAVVGDVEDLERRLVRQSVVRRQREDQRIAVAEPRADGWASDRHRRSVLWIVALATAAIVFDGYDLVVYGAVLPTLLADPSALGSIDPATAGALGSYALIGVMVGALLAGAVGDRIGRRRTMLTAIVWFSVGMGATALAPTVGAFGALRFLTGIGVGALCGISRCSRT